MNMYNAMQSVGDVGMVWMGMGQSSADITMGGLMHSDPGDNVLEQDSVYYTPSHRSMSNISTQSLEDVRTGRCSSRMDTMENYDMLHYLDIKNESNDSSYLMDDDDDVSHNDDAVYMITTSTQTTPCPNRKIRPIKHPGLVLKTPIAYQSDTDPSVIPIQKDGIAVCEKCGAIGVKHAFYTRERRFCSMACARGYSGLIPEPLPRQHQQPLAQQTSSDDDEANRKRFAQYRFAVHAEDDFTDCYLDRPLAQLSPLPELPPVDDASPLIRRKPSELANTFDWESNFSDPYFTAASVTCFKHAPMADIWDNIMVGMKVEVENTDRENASERFPDSFWVATVMRIVGYKAQLRYEGFGSNSSKDFWVTLCSNQVHPVGWCATRGKPLIPPKTIEDKYSDWKDFLRKRLTGARTLPSNFTQRAQESLKSRFERGLNLEVVDKNRISQVKLAVVHKIVGKRLNVRYYDMPAEDGGFWCHEDSPLLHPVGWARKVNHHLVAPVNYLERLNQGIYDDDDATEESFNPYQVGFVDNVPSGFEVGMKLEAIDPLNLSSICVATVMDVLDFGYIMIRIDTYDADVTGADWFCYHVKSPCIFPVGFCDKFDIPLTPPKGYDQSTFDWRTYLAQIDHRPADPALFNTFVPLHGFQQGMKIEAADLMDPRLVCIATVAKVAGRLLKVHFDGWEEEYDQWLDCESPDIYPVGWCQSVGHKLEGPPSFVRQTIQPVKSPKVKKKNRKKKPKPQQQQQQQQHQRPDGDDDDVDDAKSSRKSDGEPATPDSNMDRSEYPDSKHSSRSDREDVSIATPPTTIRVATSLNGDDDGRKKAEDVKRQEEPPVERRATSYVNSTSSNGNKVIPRLIDATTSGAGELCPDEWSIFDVAQFLRVNDCVNYCDAFSKHKIDGKTLLSLSKEDIVEFTGGKVGPSLKIFDLVQQLKIKVNPSKVRLMKANVKKVL
ncbi:unnamed protein product [Phyllotreta striolata]|uniref:Polycomb protein Sfmbt n=1 Tax=Phyllotreta striolata TaxID=444603 RepID=A0A9P0E1H5_PHYSR|nr:unnamed protein product [Phyllotreta striolata]